MTVSAVSRYQGGTEAEVLPLARALQAIYVRYGVGYRLSRVETGDEAGDWLVVVTYADAAALAEAEERFRGDADLQGVFVAIAGFAKRVRREVVVDLV